MTAKLTKAYITAQHRLENREAGQGALEYIGILAVVALVIGLAAAAFDAYSGTINSRVGELIDSVFEDR